MMVRYCVFLLLASLAATALADDPTDSAPLYPPAVTQDNRNSAPQQLPYPYAQAQTQADTQEHQYSVQPIQYNQMQYDGVLPGYYGAAAPAVALETAGVTALAVVVKAVAWVASHVAALALGGALALAVCKLTPLCSLVAHRWYRADLPTPEEVRAFTRPAAEMLRAAIDKYGRLNNQHH